MQIVICTIQNWKIFNGIGHPRLTDNEKIHSIIILYLWWGSVIEDEACEIPRWVFIVSDD